MKKIIGAVMTVLLLAGCSGTVPGEAEQTDNIGAAGLAETIPEWSEISADSGADGKTVPADVPGTETEATVSETKKPSEEVKEEIEYPIVTPVNEVYEIYPTIIKYPEKQETDLTAEKAAYNDSVYYKDVPLLNFSSEYPVFSGTDETVCSKINSSIRSYIDSVFEEDSESVKDSKPEDEEVIAIMNMYGGSLSRTITGGGFWEYSDDCYDINGNILSVYFIDYGYSMGAAHGYETPVCMTFDLRTGDRVDFNDIVEDKTGFAQRIHRGLFMYLNRNSVEEFEEYFQKNWLDTEEELGELYVQSDEDRMDFYNGRVFLDYNDADSRMTVRNGCICYYLAPYEYGTYADGIRCVEIPVSEITPYLNEKGKSLFEGYVTAEAEPINMIEYRGGRYFSTERVPDFSGISINEGDYEFISCFGDSPVHFIKCSNIDYDRLAEIDGINHIWLEECKNIDFSGIAKMKNVHSITLDNCDFDDISPLYGSGVKSISGKGKRLTESQKAAFKRFGGESVDRDLVYPRKANYYGRDYVMPSFEETYARIDISDRKADGIDLNFIALVSEGRDHLTITLTHCAGMDYRRLGKLDVSLTIRFEECGDIDFAAIAEAGNIDTLWLNNCEFDDITPLIGSCVEDLYGEGNNVSVSQAKEFEEAGGYISNDLIAGGKKTYKISNKETDIR